MIKHTRTAIMSILVASSLSVGGTWAATTDSKLPDPATAGFAEKLYRLDCGHSLANDESVWTPGENVGKSIEFSSTCWLIKRGNQRVLWDTGVPQSTINDPKGWSTLPKLIVYHLDKTITSQLADLGLKIGDINYVVLSHTHGDHIGNVGLFPDSKIVMQRVEYTWISSPDGPNDNVNQLKALARKLMGKPKHLQLVDGDTDLFGDGSVTLVSTPGHTPGSQSLLVHLENSGFIHSVRRCCSSRRKFREKYRAVPEYRQGSVNRLHGQGQADDRNIQRQTVHQSRQGTRRYAEAAASILRLMPFSRRPGRGPGVSGALCIVTHAALCRDRMAARRKDFGDTSGSQALCRHAQRGVHPGAAGPDDHDVKAVFDDFVGLRSSSYFQR